jgi:hypothetical protein
MASEKGVNLYRERSSIMTATIRMVVTEKKGQAGKVLGRVDTVLNLAQVAI